MSSHSVPIRISSKNTSPGVLCTVPSSLPYPSAPASNCSFFTFRSVAFP